MKRIYVNEEWCLGCHLCEYYCAFANSGEKDMVHALKGVTISPASGLRRRAASASPSPAGTARSRSV